MCRNDRLTVTGKFRICGYGIKFCSGLKSRSLYFLVFLGCQIAVLGILFIYILYYAESYILSGIKWKWKVAHFVMENESSMIKYFDLRINETLGNLYHIPERRKPLYVWKHEGLVQVKGFGTLLTDKERDFIHQDSCDTLQNRTKYSTTQTNYADFKNCRTLRQDIDEVNSYFFQEELDMPTAYSILVYTDFEMIELLIRTIYKPQNFYCIHIDAKSPKLFRDSVVQLAKCFDNVMLATKLVTVSWGTFSILEAEMSCMRDLLNKSKSWKYFINLTGQEFPLRTNYEIAKILKALHGFNNIKCSKNFEHTRLRASGAPPFGLRVYKSPTHVILTRQFVMYLLNDKKAQAVLNWSKKLKIPDELVFPTLNCNTKLKAPGSYGAAPSLYNQSKNFISRFKIWSKSPSHCHGKLVRDICIFGSRDLENLQTRHELFANKFHVKEFSEVPNCLRKILLKRTILEYKGYIDYNVSFYKRIPYKW